MALIKIAECDGPLCEEQCKIKDINGGFPVTWLVIRVGRSRFLGPLATESYGFHSATCFVEWAHDRRKIGELE